MTSIIKSISLDEQEDEFLKEYNLSPTKLLKEKIWEMKGMMRKIVGDKIMRLVSRVDDLTKVIIEHEDTIRVQNVELAKKDTD